MAAHPALARRVTPLRRLMHGGFVRHRLPATESRVELTFDDGPSPTHTPLVLERLAQFDVRATFFVVGRFVLQHRSILKQIHAAGHRIGNHSLTHPRFGLLNPHAVRDEIRFCQHAVEDCIGVTPTQLRPPFGRITPGVILAARREGLSIMNWSVDTGDWRCRDAGDAERCAEETAGLVRPRDVILLHDNHRWIARILDEMLPRLAWRGLLSAEN